ncbi:MAG: glycosyltransferase [Acidimicrobiia bacterium]
MSGSSDAVCVYSATINTATCIELCVRTARRTAGMEFDLVVGDGGSTDGSLETLRRFEARGWLTLEVAPEGRRHSQWLDHWLDECPARYAVFVDSDMRFRRNGWLRDLVDAARASRAAMVTSRIQHSVGPTVGPDGTKMAWADRPTPWLMLVDIAQVRDVVTAGFGFRSRVDPDDPGTKIMFDTGAAFLEDLTSCGLQFHEMGANWSRCYQHFGGMTWIREREHIRLLHRFKLKTRGASAWTHLQLERARAITQR